MVGGGDNTEGIRCLTISQRFAQEQPELTSLPELTVAARSSARTNVRGIGEEEWKLWATPWLVRQSAPIAGRPPRAVPGLHPGLRCHRLHPAALPAPQVADGPLPRWEAHVVPARRGAPDSTPTKPAPTVSAHQHEGPAPTCCSCAGCVCGSASCEASCHLSTIQWVGTPPVWVSELVKVHRFFGVSGGFLSIGNVTVLEG